jgi:hypothetical protein
VSPTGKGAALHPAGEEETYARTEIHRHRRQAVRPRELLQRRREQVAAASRVELPALFDMKKDCRPASERTASGRYSEPSLFRLSRGTIKSVASACGEV